MRYPFLALLAQGPAHGYELKQSLEHLFGSLLAPLNGGQVYTTLARLERDGLVAADAADESNRGKRVYAITDAGRAQLREWIETPTHGPRLNDEFFTKLTLVGSSGLGDPKTLIERQRRENLQSLRDLEQAASRLVGNGSAVGRLLIEGAALRLQADLKWLVMCEEQIVPKEEPDGNSPRS